jgi:putative tryptophan/tyrosine transport system substrate-binding protein
MTFAPRARAQQTAPSAGRTSQQKKLPRIGVLWPDAAPAVRIEEFRQGLRDLGYIEGENIVIEYHYAEARRERLPTLAAELAGSNVDVIVALTTLAARPAKDATNTIPIVMISGDPIGTGLVSNLARPGGNVTGLTFFSPDLAGKRLEVLKELVPALTRVGIVWDVQGPAKAIEFAAASAAAGDLGLEVESIEVQAAAPDLDTAFAAAAERRVGALLVVGNPLTLGHRKRITELALANRLPSMYDSIQFVQAGGLVSYGPSFSDLYRRSAIYVDKILKGARPAELPVEQPTKFELAII